MTSNAPISTTTYVYKPLQSQRHIRLLEISSCIPDEQNSQPSFSLIQAELPPNDTQFEFEAISYTWGNPDRIFDIPIDRGASLIGLTANLAEALPHITKHSTTQRLWIDQLCINQADDVEKSIQVGLMSEIYKRATRVIVWLGQEDENSRLGKQWLGAFDKLIPTLNLRERVAIDSPEYSPDIRKMILMDTFTSPDTSPIWLPAIGRFWKREWFRRGWVVQEMILARELLYLTGDISFTLQDLEDLFTAPMDKFHDFPDLRADLDNGIISYRILMQLKTDPFTRTPEPLRFLRIMATVGDEFLTKEPGDRLYGFLGLIEGLDFTPNYQTSIEENFTRFTATIARQYGSLDFLSLWSSNLDSRLPDTHPAFLNFPSWVPSFTTTPLCAPWRLAVGGVRSWDRELSWNAAARRPHIHHQTTSATCTKKLHVRGQIIDHIALLSSTRIAKYRDVDTAYLASLTTQIQSDIPGLNHWSYVDLIHFLNTVASNGATPRESAEQILDLEPSVLPDEQRHLLRHDSALGACLMMGKGRKVMRTEGGRLGLAPWMDSRAGVGGEKGSAIVVLHGCCVPVVLERVIGGGEEGGEGEEWVVVGDCYVEGSMFGEGVGWEVKDAREFVLV
ncbi:HET-domain-containing protein [Plenodomus tracheiphilus IPT5]|uniref:HET-domain-containing protein n=1 Tax=Plenodomus tracheiphilus IPT5 TaxID=1408161 RepID=A0A6A7BLY2_9PLEO|nr:HET-domain-containing protein [Plenodomus tracheiphilus IPT5]